MEDGATQTSQNSQSSSTGEDEENRANVEVINLEPNAANIEAAADDEDQVDYDENVDDYDAQLAADAIDALINAKPAAKPVVTNQPQAVVLNNVIQQTVSLKELTYENLNRFREFVTSNTRAGRIIERNLLIEEAVRERLPFNLGPDWEQMTDEQFFAALTQLIPAPGTIRSRVDLETRVGEVRMQTPYTWSIMDDYIKRLLEVIRPDKHSLEQDQGRQLRLIMILINKIKGDGTILRNLKEELNAKKHEFRALNDFLLFLMNWTKAHEKLGQEAQTALGMTWWTDIPPGFQENRPKGQGRGSSYSSPEKLASVSVSTRDSLKRPRPTSTTRGPTTSGHSSGQGPQHAKAADVEAITRTTVFLKPTRISIPKT
jgi:hypothetical protein